MIALCSLGAILYNADYRPGVYGVAVVYVVALAYFGAAGRHRLVFSPEEEFAMTLGKHGHPEAEGYGQTSVENHAPAATEPAGAPAAENRLTSANQTAVSSPARAHAARAPGRDEERYEPARRSRSHHRARGRPGSSAMCASSFGGSPPRRASGAGSRRTSDATPTRSSSRATAFRST